MLLLVESRHKEAVYYLVKAEKLSELVIQYKLFNEAIIIREVPDALVAFLTRDWLDDVWQEVLNIASSFKDVVTNL